MLAFDAAPDNLLLRDGCIKRFEYSYELAHKMLRRYLSATEPSAAEIDAMSFPDRIRLGFARGVLAEEWVAWRRYREARNITSHAYDRGKAEEVMKIIPEFLASARHMLQELKRRQARAS